MSNAHTSEESSLSTSLDAPNQASSRIRDAGTKYPISVIILTKNEEGDLPTCLESVQWSADIHVLDSLSTDRTVQVAESFGAKVRARKFDGYASQRNAGLHETEFANEWVLILDADEVIPEELAEEMFRFVSSPTPGVAAGKLRRRDFFEGTWLKHAQMSAYYVRLVRPKEVHFQREVNEVLVVAGGIHDFVAPFDHYPFSKGLSHWVEKHNLYSTMEAAELVRQRQSLPPNILSALLSGDFHQRRQAQKALFYRMPFRPFIKWVYLVLVRGAFLDGRAGLTYANLMFIYEMLITIKAWEITERSHPND